MISVEEAIQNVLKKCNYLSPENIPVQDSLNRVIASDVLSLINMPPFPQSAMDGYAVYYVQGVDHYKVVGEIAAGDSDEGINLSSGECVRIFTGAMVPNTANVVIKQEDVNRIDNSIDVLTPAHLGTNIRAKGEQIEKGDVALETGTIISPAAIGFLLGLGITHIDVINQPKIAIIATGNELVTPGEKLPSGKIYESNSFMLSAALKQYGYTRQFMLTIGDTYEATKTAIQGAFEQSDVLIVSGGISVGDYDFVGKALLEMGVTQEFYKVKQKPGKPLFFGTLNDKKVFALPGNPAAAMTSFYIYVLRGLDLMAGRTKSRLTKSEIPLAESYVKKGDRAQFLKARIKDGQAHILDAQSSAMLKSFAISNGLVYIPASVNEIKAGNCVTTYLIGNN